MFVLVSTTLSLDTIESVEMHELLMSVYFLDHKIYFQLAML